MSYKFLRNKRALVVNDFLVVSDLHIGYKKELEEKGYSVPNQADAFAKEIMDIAKNEKLKKLIILGDVKHKVPGIAYEEKYDVPNFLYKLSKYFKKIILIKGNHDAKIELMAHQENVEVVDEFIYGNVGFIHGHKWPSEEFMEQAEIIIMGHSHPVFKITDSQGYRHYYPSWTICKIKRGGLKRYKNKFVTKVVVVPPFNPMLTGIKDLVGPIAKSLRKDEIFLLDGTKVK